jgi:hypothetical protein
VKRRITGNCFLTKWPTRQAGESAARSIPLKMDTVSRPINSPALCPRSVHSSRGVNPLCETKTLLSLRQQNLNPVPASVIVQSGGAQRAGLLVAL